MSDQPDQIVERTSPRAEVDRDQAGKNGESAPYPGVAQTTSSGGVVACVVDARVSDS